VSQTSNDLHPPSGGPEATLGIAGLAVGLISGFVQPVYAGIAGGIGLALAVGFQLLPARPWFRVLVRLGIGLVIGAVLFFGLTATGLVPTRHG